MSLFCSGVREVIPSLAAGGGDPGDGCGPPGLGEGLREGGREDWGCSLSKSMTSKGSREWRGVE